MLAQPRFRHLGRAAFHDIDPVPGLGIDQHGRVGMAAAQCEFTGAEHAGNGNLGQRKPQQQAQYGIPRQRDSQHRQHPGPGPPG